MPTPLQQKAIDCLKLCYICHTRDGEQWRRAYEIICAKYSEKAVIAKMEELTSRGYMEYGVSVRTGWLTDKGREALLSCQHH